MPIITVNDINMYYEIEGAGESLLLIHGLAGDHTFFDEMIKPFLAKKYKVVSMDLRGHGKTTADRGEYTTVIFAKDISRLMEKIGINGAVVIGISMGGAVAMELASSYPEKVRKLVLIDTWDKCDEATRAFFWEWIEIAKRSKKLLQKVVLIRTVTPEFVKANPDFVELFTEEWPPNYSKAFIKSCLTCAGHNATGKLHKIKAPTLVIVGERDILVPPRISERFSKKIKNSRLKIIKGGGHIPWLDNPDETLRTLSKFLNISWKQ